MSLGKDDRVTIEAAGLADKGRQTNMTVTLPQKAGYVATTKEWDDLVRIAENLAAQVVQRDAALRGMQAERDAARAEVARLRAALETYAEAREMVLKALPAVAINETEEIWGASNTALVRKALSFLWHCGALRQPAPAGRE